MRNSIFLLALALIFSCKKNPESIGPCGTTTPLKDLPFLVEKIELLSKPPDIGYAIFSCIYKKKRVFWIYSIFSVPADVYYDCEGNFFYDAIPSPNDDEETKLFRRLLGHSKESCQYKIWSTPIYDDITTTCP